MELIDSTERMDSALMFDKTLAMKWFKLIMNMVLILMFILVTGGMTFWLFKEKLEKNRYRQSNFK